MFSSGFAYEPIDIGLAETKRVRPFGAVLEQLGP